MVALHNGAFDRDVRGLEIHSNLCAGIGLVRGGAGTALVGSHAEVADRIEEYHALGVEEFIFSGYPHLEEAYWFAEGVAVVTCDRASSHRRSAHVLAVTCWRAVIGRVKCGIDHSMRLGGSDAISIMSSGSY
jgi:hypothetical protein